MSARDLPAAELAEVTTRELLDRVLALPKVAPRSAVQCRMRNMARALAIEFLCKAALDDALTMAQDGAPTQAENFIVMRDWARQTADEIQAGVLA